MDAGSVEAAAFKAFEAEGWTRKAQTYDRLTGRVTARLVMPLLEAAGVQSGTRLLDVACGPGHIAAEAAAKGAEPVGLDAAEGMVAVARARYAQIAFQRGDAERLPFADASFDAVVAGFVVNHLPHPERALAEFVRVVRSGAQAKSERRTSHARCFAARRCSASDRVAGASRQTLDVAPCDRFSDDGPWRRDQLIA